MDSSSIPIKGEKEDILLIIDLVGTDLSIINYNKGLSLANFSFETIVTSMALLLISGTTTGACDFKKFSIGVLRAAISIDSTNGICDLVVIREGSGTATTGNTILICCLI